MLVLGLRETFEFFWLSAIDDSALCERVIMQLLIESLSLASVWRPIESNRLHFLHGSSACPSSFIHFLVTLVVSHILVSRINCRITSFSVAL
jgi:hypothetical protein